MFLAAFGSALAPSHFRAVLSPRPAGKPLGFLRTSRAFGVRAENIGPLGSFEFLRAICLNSLWIRLLRFEFGI